MTLPLLYSVNKGNVMTSNTAPHFILAFPATLRLHLSEELTTEQIEVLTKHIVSQTQEFISGMRPNVITQILSTSDFKSSKGTQQYQHLHDHTLNKITNADVWVTDFNLFNKPTLITITNGSKNTLPG